jgi:threonylcarbamoyladenosine tRNA methylthiotransferase MtaB
MKSQYTVAQFIDVVKKAKCRLDRPAITTDIIVGFPGETDEDFAQSTAIAEDVHFSKMHIFRFSPRAGTAASRMQPIVPSGVIKERSSILHNLDKQLQAGFRRQFIGEKVSVIIERQNPAGGKTERYFEVDVVSAKSLKKGEMVWGILSEYAGRGCAVTEKMSLNVKSVEDGTTMKI